VATGALRLAFRSDAPGGRAKYPATCNAKTQTVSAALTHFSTWKSWTWDRASILPQGN
jgi:hypothetical protein